ncbi:hypothetical protein B0H10DRAFT_1968175 [Mycena sp. CBHHK59/15]|nr:hypothetical protein B0H10DRAFT_1968175 [Mycena sp. CBHHK59/15]
MVDDDADTAATAATAVGGVTPNSELEELYMAYHTRRDSNTSDFSMFAQADQIVLTTDATEYPPFAADTGATIHLSPLKDDFYTLQTIKVTSTYAATTDTPSSFATLYTSPTPPCE